MTPAPPRVGDLVVIMLAPYETGRVERIGAEPPEVEVRVAAGHLVAVGLDEVRVFERHAPDLAAAVAESAINAEAENR